MGATFALLDRFPSRDVAGTRVRSWASAGWGHDGSGSTYFVALEGATVTTPFGDCSVPAGGYGVVVEPVEMRGGRGLAITDPTRRALFCVGGPVEDRGRLRYIDGCSDTVLLAPVVRGDPCLNLLHIPAGVVQTDHDHPSMRIGVVLSGSGRCILTGGRVERLTDGTVFLLEAGTTHRFESGPSPMTLVAWHPDSDFGPTDDDHPMLNRTLRPGTTARVR